MRPMVPDRPATCRKPGIRSRPGSRPRRGWIRNSTFPDAQRDDGGAFIPKLQPPNRSCARRSDTQGAIWLSALTAPVPSPGGAKPTSTWRTEARNGHRLATRVDGTVAKKGWIVGHQGLVTSSVRHLTFPR